MKKTGKKILLGKSKYSQIKISPLLLLIQIYLECVKVVSGDRGVTSQSPPLSTHIHSPLTQHRLRTQALTLCPAQGLAQVRLIPVLEKLKVSPSLNWLIYGTTDYCCPFITFLKTEDFALGE